MTSIDTQASKSEEEEADVPDYGSSEYWNNRYKTKEFQFDWYLSWEQLVPNLQPLFTGNEIVLNLGCGNSSMSADMLRSTFSNSPNIVSIDISDVVISQMKELYKDYSKLSWHQMDCSAMDFPDRIFDLVFDKGTLDALFCGENSEYRVLSTLCEIERILIPGGLFIEITYGEPNNRMNVFNEIELDWYLHKPMIIEHPEKPGSFYYVYIFQKLLVNHLIKEEEEEFKEEECSDSENCNEEEQVNPKISKEEKPCE